MQNSEQSTGGTPVFPLLKVLPYILLSVDVFFATYFKMPDGDSWMHLAQGRYILQQKTIPTTDVFSFTHYGHVWINWEWLHNIFVALVWQATGYDGLLLLRFSVVLVTIILLFAMLKNVPCSALISFFLASLSLLFIQYRIDDRPHLFSYFFIVLVLYFLFPRRPFTKLLLFFLFLSLILWRNIHPSWPLGAMMIVSVFVDDAFLMFKKGVPAVTKPALKTLMCFVAGVFLVYATTPYSQKFDNYISLQREGAAFLGEWQPFSVLGPQIWTVTFLPFLLFVPIILVVLFATIKEGFFYRLLALAMLVTVYYHVRFIPEATLLGIPLVATFLGRLEKRRPRYEYQLLFIVLIFLMSVFISQNNFKNLHLQRGVGVDEEKNPLFAAEFMEENGLRGNIYGSFPGTMEFLLHQMFSKVKVPVDIRVPGLYSFEYAEKLWKVTSDEDLDHYVLSLPVDYIIIGCPKHIAPSREQEAGIELSLRRRQWSLLYFDHLYAVYRRPGLDDGVFSFLLFSRWNTDMKELDRGIEEGRFDDILRELTKLKKNTAGRDDFYREIMVSLYASPSLSDDQKRLLERTYDKMDIEHADF